MSWYNLAYLLLVVALYLSDGTSFHLALVVVWGVLCTIAVAVDAWASRVYRERVRLEREHDDIIARYNAEINIQIEKFLSDVELIHSVRHRHRKDCN